VSNADSGKHEEDNNGWGRKMNGNEKDDGRLGSLYNVLAGLRRG